MASLLNSGRRAFLYVLLEESTGVLFELRRSAEALLRREGVPLSCLPRVALDRGETNVEQVGSLSFGGPTFESGHYLLAEVFGVGFHPYMFSPES